MTSHNSEHAKKKAKRGEHRRARASARAEVAVTDPARLTEIHDLLAEVKSLWSKHPDWRLAQVITNAASAGERPNGAPRDDVDIFYVEDDVIRIGLRNLIAR